MKKRLMRGTGLLLTCAVLFWCGRIYSVNQACPAMKTYHMQDEIVCNNITLTPTEAHLYNEEEFAEVFGPEAGEVLSGLKEWILVEGTEFELLCVCMEASNNTDEALSWDEVMLQTEGGFESLTWGTMSEGYLEQAMNIFYTKELPAHATQEIWHVAFVNRICFKDRTWEKLSDTTFYYSLLSFPEKTRIELELEEADG